MSQKERVFADGFRFERKDSAPEYVVGRLSLKIDEAVAFINKHANANGWINLSVMIGRSGNPYVELDTYEPKQSTEPQEVKTASKAGLKLKPTPEPEVEEEDDEELPF
jgi:hypothetical protein